MLQIEWALGAMSFAIIVIFVIEDVLYVLRFA